MIYSGIDILLQQAPAWKTSSIAMVTNHAALTKEGIPSRKALMDAGFHIKLLFSPEHGLDVQGADGHPVNGGTDQLTGLPVVSLYGRQLAPAAGDLSHIDLILYDIPDVGSRFYTYLWTMTYVMEAAAQHGKQLVILDRPNPLSGKTALAEGPVLEMNNASFIGRWPIPIRHSCTLGELALYFNRSRALNTALDIIPCEGWHRSMFQPDWQLPFVPTSPAIRRFESMLLYPGLCLLEATNISEGRGADHSFTVAGAPWINGKTLAEAYNHLEAQQAKAIPVGFVPSSGKYKNEQCNGIGFMISQPESFRPVYHGFLLIKLIRDLYPQQFNWATYPTHVNPGGKHHLDKLTGISYSEALFDQPFADFLLSADRLTTCTGWPQEIRPYLLYL